MGRRHDPDDPETAKSRLGWGRTYKDDGQIDLFSITHARTTDPVTSKAAAASLTNVGRQKSRLLEVYRENPDGLTSNEAGRLAAMPEAHKRVSDLLRDGSLVDTGTTRKDTDTGRAGRVLRLA